MFTLKINGKKYSGEPYSLKSLSEPPCGAEIFKTVRLDSFPEHFFVPEANLYRVQGNSKARTFLIEVYVDGSFFPFYAWVTDYVS